MEGAAMLVPFDFVQFKPAPLANPANPANLPPQKQELKPGLAGLAKLATVPDSSGQNATFNLADVPDTKPLPIPYPLQTLRRENCPTSPEWIRPYVPGEVLNDDRERQCVSLRCGAVLLRRDDESAESWHNKRFCCAACFGGSPSLPLEVAQ